MKGNKMKLWKLEPISATGAWDPWYDKAFGFVVRAETEEIARGIADCNAGDENYGGGRPWLDEKQSSCIELLPDGEEGLVMRDFAAA